MLDTIALDIPFALLSTQINRLGKTEKRILTPFGTLDMTFTRVWNTKRGKGRLEIEINGDTETWLLYDQALGEFKKAIMNFVWNIAERHLDDATTDLVDEFEVHIKGHSVDQSVPHVREKGKS